jgi:pimeloyl-ACP methyl ester carboxylesterase
MGHDTTTVMVHDHETTVRTGGTGPALLWLHAEANTSGWSEFHDRLAEHFTVTAPVHPGFGGAALPRWLGDMSDIALHYVDLIRVLELDRPIVVGASLGGWRARSGASHRADLLSGLMLIGSLGVRPDEPMPDLFLMSPQDALPYLSESVDIGGVDPMTGDIDLVTALWVEQATQARLMWERSYDRRAPRRAHHITCPTAVLWGEADKLLPVEHGRQVASLVGADLTIVEQAGHFAHLDHPGPVADAARAFANKIGLTA